MQTLIAFPRAPEERKVCRDVEYRQDVPKIFISMRKRTVFWPFISDDATKREIKVFFMFKR